MKILFQFIKKKTNFQYLMEDVLSLSISNIDLYTRALTHTSLKDSSPRNNERLEYLGDAILSGIVADFLYTKYPLKDEGFLTEMRSKIVNRQQLNDVALKMGFRKLIFYNKGDAALKKSQIFGNALEAMVGAVYLDKGFDKTKHWVITQLILPHINIKALETTDINTKNKLISWSMKNNKTIHFEVAKEELVGKRKNFEINIMVDGKEIAKGIGFNKRSASQNAAQLAAEKLGIS